jgi:O86/O127-antigen biosynthesis beta-1,3-galactosyltransferase
MPHEPKITVLMPVVDADKYFHLAVKSILLQSFNDFRLFIIVNGEKSKVIATHISDVYDYDKRVTVLSTCIRGVASALNYGLTNVETPYVARADADDIYRDIWLQRMLFKLEEKKLDIVGCFLDLIDSNGNMIGVRKYPTGKSIYRKYLYTCPFAHNTILAKTCVLKDAGGYQNGSCTEDYDLWIRLFRNPIRADNIPESLVFYRVHNLSTQRAKLPYCEVSGYFMREFLLRLNLSMFVALVFSLIKRFARPLR